MALAAVNLFIVEHPWWDGAGPGSGPGPWWVVFPVLWLALIAVAVTLLVVNVRRRGRLAGRRAGETRLAERFASGEIDEHEYQAMLTTLKEVNR